MKSLLAIFRRKKKPREVLDFMGGWEDEKLEEVENEGKNKKDRKLQHAILYIRTTDHQLWGKDKSGWKLLANTPDIPVIVITNLAEESFSEITMPRLYGRDRTSYLARQLATRFPESPYRAVLPASHKGNLLEKFSPTSQVLVGIDSAERIQALIKEHGCKIQGYWPVSLLMAQWGKSVFLPEDIFVVFPGPGGLRIVFLKDRTPVLTRLVPKPELASAQVDEIIRTLRYLENMHLVDRGSKRHNILILGDTTELAPLLAEARFDLVKKQSLDDTPPDDWRFPLFNRVIRNPPGQLAPLSQRTEYLSGRINRIAINARYASIVAAIAFVGSQIPLTNNLFEQKREVDAALQQTSGQLSEIENKIAGFGVTPDLVRRVIDLDNKEIDSAPPLGQQLQLIAGAVSVVPDLRLKSIQWRLLHPTITMPCNASTSPDQSPVPIDPPVDPANPGHRTEVLFDLFIPQNYSPSERASSLSVLSNELSKLKGVRIYQDASKDSKRETLKGGISTSEEKSPIYCLTIVNVSDAPLTPTGATIS